MTPKKPAPPSEICATCPLNAQVQIYLETHERRISDNETNFKNLDNKIDEINTVVAQAKILFYMAFGGGLLSILSTLATIITLVTLARDLIP